MLSNDYAIEALQQDVKQLRSIVNDMIGGQEGTGLDVIEFDELLERVPYNRDALYRLTSQHKVPGTIKQGRKLLFIRTIVLRWAKEQSLKTVTRK